MLRNLLSRPEGVVRVIGVTDGFSARLGALAGFDALWASGLGICAAHGVPDAGILGISDFLAAAATMRRAADVPVIADCDSGFGDANVVRNMIRRYEDAGIAAVCIEDKALPKRNSFVPRQALADPYEFATKLMVAKSALRRSKMLVIARVEALVAGAGEEEALRRAHLYQESGADAIMIHSKACTPAEVLGFAQRWPGRPSGVPLLVSPTTYPCVDVADLERAGIAAVIYSNQALRAAHRAIEYILQKLLNEGTTAGVEQHLTTIEELFEVIGMLEVQMTDAWVAETLCSLRRDGAAAEAHIA